MLDISLLGGQDSTKQRLEAILNLEGSKEVADHTNGCNTGLGQDVWCIVSMTSHIKLPSYI